MNEGKDTVARKLVEYKESATDVARWVMEYLTGTKEGVREKATETGENTKEKLGETKESAQQKMEKVKERDKAPRGMKLETGIGEEGDEVEVLLKVSDQMVGQTFNDVGPMGGKGARLVKPRSTDRDVDDRQGKK